MGNTSFERCEYCKGQRCTFKYISETYKTVFVTYQKEYKNQVKVVFGALNIPEHKRLNLDNDIRDIQMFKKIYL